MCLYTPTVVDFLYFTLTSFNLFAFYLSFFFSCRSSATLPFICGFFMVYSSPSFLSFFFKKSFSFLPVHFYLHPVGLTRFSTFSQFEVYRDLPSLHHHSSCCRCFSLFFFNFCLFSVRFIRYISFCACLFVYSSCLALPSLDPRPLNCSILLFVIFFYENK